MNMKDDDIQNEYKKIFIEKTPVQIEIEDKENNKKHHKENKFISTFFVQSLICIVIIALIVSIKYLTPSTFVSVSSALNGLYEENITLSDLNEIINKNILQNDTISAFFNIDGVRD